MEPARVRFLEEGEEPVLPKWTKLLPQRWRQRKTVDTYPYTLTRVDGVLTGILQAERTAVLTADWRRGASRLLAALEEAGAAIIVPPAEGEFPRERLPFAEGRRLAQLFAFAGAAEALRRQGRNPEESAFLLAGGEPHIWGRVLSSLGNEVNRLAIFTQEPETAEGVVQRLYAERGLMAEVFSSPKNAALGAADVVLSCGMEQRAYEHILKRGCIWLDFALFCGGLGACARIFRRRRGSFSAWRQRAESRQRAGLPRRGHTLAVRRFGKAFRQRIGTGSGCFPPCRRRALPFRAFPPSAKG